MDAGGFIDDVVRAVVTEEQVWLDNNERCDDVHENGIESHLMDNLRSASRTFVFK